VNVTGEVKLFSGAEAKASLNRALSLWHSDVKRDDLGMARLKLG
jgi:hypothetical protein